MRWTRGHQSNNLEDRRAMGPAVGGGGMNVVGIVGLLSRFGWKGILVGIVIAAVLYGSGQCSGIGGGSSSRQAVTQTSSSEDEQVQFVGFVFDDLQASWTRRAPGYQEASIVVFRGAVESACGTNSSAVGPFYCPTDRKVYIDLSFYGELERRFGAPGDFAQAYVIAHEIGHHIQQQRGVLGGGSVDSIEVELQADCLAGAWARDAEARKMLQVGDIEEALGAASAIGDDSIQKKTTGRIQPETWTHGSAKQRVAAFQRGYRGNGADACGL